MIGTFMVDKSDECDEFDLVWRDRRLFRDAVDLALDELAHGHTSLRHAAAQIITAGEQWNQDYLLGVDLNEQGQTRSERVARNILRHFKMRHREQPSAATRMLLEHIERELEEMAGDGHKLRPAVL
jgi:hypothetical protein